MLASVTTGSGKPLPPVLKAITYAAQLLYHHQLAQQYSSEAAATATAAAADGGAEDAAGLDPAVVEALAAGGRVQQQELDDAWQLLQEVQVSKGGAGAVPSACSGVTTSIERRARV